MISGGRLRFKATIYRNLSNVDNVGKRTDTYTGAGSFRCDVIDTGALEVDYADGATPQNSYEVYARYDSIYALSLTEKDRLQVTDGRQTLHLNITGIRNTGFKNRVALITCEGVKA